MAVKIVETYSRIEKRQDAVFYQGHGKVAQVECDGFSVDVYCDGDMRAIYDCPSEVILRSAKDFIDYGLDTDLKLQKANEEGVLHWDMNPWFDCYTSDGEHLDIVCDTIEEAIASALFYVKGERASELVMLQDF
jgi:hypothetical protein